MTQTEDLDDFLLVSYGIFSESVVIGSSCKETLEEKRNGSLDKGKVRFLRGLRWIRSGGGKELHKRWVSWEREADGEAVRLNAIVVAYSALSFCQLRFWVLGFGFSGRTLSTTMLCDKG